MSRKTKILSFLLALVLAFGCMTTTLFAVAQTEVQGGEITEEDIQNGTTDAITGTAHPNSGIKTADEIAALIGEDKIAFEFGDDDYENSSIALNYVNGVSQSHSAGGFYSVKSEGEETYLVIGEASGVTFEHGKKSEIYINNTNNYASGDNFAGEDFVVGIDLRLTKNVSDSLYMNFLRLSMGASVNRFPLSIKGDGSIVIEKGYMSTGVAYTIEEAVNSGADVPFTNVSVHVHPSTNSFDVYIDGICKTSGIKTVLFSNDDLKAIATAAGADSSLTAAELYEIGKANVVFKDARFFPNGNTYHGANCPDTCTETHTDATKVPFMFTGEQIHVDTIKAYYSDLFLECSGSSENITVAEGHTHNEENLTVATSVVCNNCKAKWNVVIPMDQTGNSLCDLCEIDNANQDVTEFHNAEQIKKAIIKAAGLNHNYVNVIDGSSDSTKGAPSKLEENGNTYYNYNKNNTAETYWDVSAGGPANSASNAKTALESGTAKKGESFVIQADVKLGANFYEETNITSFYLFNIYAYVQSNFTALQTYLVQITSSGEVQVRYSNESTSNYNGHKTVATLSADKFTSIALHVKTGASGTKLGTYDVYVDGVCVAANIQFLRQGEVDAIAASYIETATGETKTLSGISDYCFGYVRTAAIKANKVTVEDYISFDNLMAYYSDEYKGTFTRHEYETNSHTHDYSKKCIEYGTTCKYCSAGQGGYAVLDADGDKICDYCVSNHEFDTTGNGVQNPTDIAGLVGSANVKFATAINDTTNFGFQYTGGRSESVTYQTDDNGNAYIKLGYYASGSAKPQQGVEHSNTAIQQSIKDNPDGRSFVASADLRLGADYSGLMNVFIMQAKINFVTTDGTTSSTTFDLYQIRIDTDGTILYRDGAVSDSTASTRLEGYKLNTTDFTTVAIHVRPGVGEYGLYDIYIDGNLVKSNIQFLNKNTNAKFVWTADDLTTEDVTDDTISSAGAKNYTLWQMAYFNKTASGMGADHIHLDNPKIYYTDEYVEHKEHTYASAGEHTHNLNNKTIEITMECACGHKDLITLPIDTTLDGACDTCNNFILDGGVFVTARQAILDDMISMKFYAQVSAETAANTEAYAVLTAGNRTERYKLSELTANSDGLYEFTIKLRSIDLASDITMAIEIDGVPGEQEFTATARDYIEDLMAVTDLAYVKDICVAILNYGAAAQTYFAEKNKDDTIKATIANENLTDEQKALVGSVSKDTLKNYEMSITGEATDVVFNAATLVLDSTVSVKIFFTAPEGAAVTLNGTEVTPVKAGSEYYITIADLLPQELDTAHTIVVTTGTATKTLTLSTLSTIYQLLIASDEQVSASFKDLGRAIYLYNLAADAYKVFEGDSAVSATANVVVKNDAKGAVALIYDDGNVNAADFIKGYLNDYTSTDVSFALRTSYYATLSTNDDGTYSYTQTAAQEEKTAYWTEYQNTYGDRVEYLNHSYTHKEGDNYEEILGSQHIIQTLFGYEGQTFVIPGFDSGTKTEEYDALAAATNLVCRSTENTTDAANMVSTLETFRTERDSLPAFMASYKTTWLTEEGKFNTDKDTAIQGNAGEGNVDISFIKSFIDSAMDVGGLAAFCFHYIVEDGGTTGYTSMDNLMIYDSQARAIFEYVNTLSATGELWSATFGEVCEYYCEWSTSSLDVRELRDGVLAINLTDSEDDAVCNTRLTVKISVADDWTGATLNQGSYTEEVEVKGEAGAKYVLVNVLPDGGIATLSAN